MNMNRQDNRQSGQPELTSHLSTRQGFTLTEMLVAVGLLLVIMTIFAQIFQLAVTAMTSQKGLANNNQRARTAFTVLDADLKRMSYRSIKGQGGIVPLVPGLLYNSPTSGAADEQEGYFYYSENDPNNNGDDVLQFTVDASITGQFRGARRYAGQAELPYYGRALGLDSNSSRRDQPDWDDGNYGDNIATSRWAEVSYFLRNGTLYRRVVLIRDTDDGRPGNMEAFDAGDTQRLAQPGAFVDNTSPTPDQVRGYMQDYGGNFYTDFDFSAHFDQSPYTGDLSNPSGNNVAVFHGSLSNDPENNWPLGVSNFRFGFSPTTGRPREYVTDGTTSAYIGRYTHEETSNPNFLYPQATSANIFGRTDFDIAALQATGRLNVFANGARRGSDILLTNVHSFDVEIWDPNAIGVVPNTTSSFVDIGDTGIGITGDFANAQKLNTAYGSVNGPGVERNNVFDTWHAVADVNAEFGLTQTGSGEPPFVPKRILPSSPTILTWTNNTSYNVGDIVRPSATYESTAANNHQFINDAILYECITDGFSAELAGDEPNWSRDVTTGAFPETNTAEFPVGSGMFRDPAEWIPVDNRKPIKAIRVTIRFLDPTSNQMRQLSLVHSFNEDEI